jgi:ATP adenylyltransferase
MEKCLFCRLRQEPECWVASNERCFAIEDANPVTLGHTLVIPRRHEADYFLLSDAERAAIEALLAKRRQELLADDATIAGFNIGINVGSAAGQTVFHCHVHLIPRRAGDVAEPRGGVRGVIPERQAY